MKTYPPGARIAGLYEVVSRPLMGGMGIVYLCFDHQEQRPVALKTFKPEYLPDRFLLRCELDAAYFHLYGIARDDVDYIMDTFPIVKRKDEATHGEYRTKRVILDIYDAMQQAIATSQPCQTLLDPPPADPGVTHLQRKPKMKEARQDVGKMHIICMI